MKPVKPVLVTAFLLTYALFVPGRVKAREHCVLEIKDKQWAINRGIDPSRLDQPIYPVGRYWEIESRQFIYQWMGVTLPSSKIRISKNPQECFALTAWSEDRALSKQEIPIGTELIEGRDGQMRGRTPGGRIIDIQLDDYDRWWLSKADDEQSQWLDIYHTAVESGQLGSTTRFVKFMKVVMSTGLTLDDFKN